MSDRIATCRLCHEQFVAREDEKEITWHHRSQGHDYHMSCWKKYTDTTKEKNSEEWLDLIFDLITRELHESYDYFKIKAQAENYIKGNRSMKGIYFTLYWYFLIKKKPYKQEYGIGIVPFVYDDAVLYWAERKKKENSIMEEIEKLKTIDAMEAKIINVNKSKRKKKRSEEPVF